MNFSGTQLLTGPHPGSGTLPLPAKDVCNDVLKLAFHFWKRTFVYSDCSFRFCLWVHLVMSSG